MQGDSPNIVSNVDETPHWDEHTSLLHQILTTLESFPSAHKVVADDRAIFWKMYEREASSYDNEFLEKYHNSLDIVLIFAGLFSAINTSFLNSLQSDLSPDPNVMTHALLRLMISTMSNSTLGETDLSLPAWTGPRASTIWTQSSLYASLSLCILSALGAILGKQWLGHYARADVGGTADDRRRTRQRKREALRAWHFTTVLEATAALLQIALLLFGIGVAMLLWNQQRLIAGVVIGATVFGSIFYLTIFIASVASSDCPFKTPNSDVVRNFLQSQRQRVHAWLWELEVTVAMSPPKGPIMTMLLKHVLHPIMDIIFRPQDTLPPVLKKNNRKRSQTQAGTRLEEWELVGSTLCFTPVDRGLEPWISESAQEMDMMSIQWLLTNSADKGVTLSALPMIEEVRWPAQRDLCPILQELLCWLCNLLDRPEPYGRIVMEPSQEDKAISVAKAVLCLSYAITQKDLPSLPGLGIRFSETGAALNFLLAEICERFGEEQRRQQSDSVPKILLPWATHFILLKLFEVEDELQFPEPLLGQAFDLGMSALVILPLPTNKVLANALVALAVSLEIDVDKEDALITDKSWAIGSMVRVICQRISVILSHKAISSAEGVPNDLMNRACRLILPIIEFCETKTEAIAESHRVLAALTPQVVQRASSLQGNQTGTAVKAYTERWTAKVSELLSSQDQSERLITACTIVPAVWEEIKAENVIFRAEVIQRLAELTNEYAGLLTRQIPGASIPIDHLRGNIRVSSALIAQGGYQVEKEEQAKGMLQALDALLQHKALDTDSSVEKAEPLGERPCGVVEGEEKKPSHLPEGHKRTDDEHSR